MSAPRILLTGVFKPFGVDDMYGRVDSKIELYHNQLTKYQGVYSMRDFMQTFGLHVIAKNIEVPVTVLEYPTLNRYRREIRKGYDIVGIGSILQNFQKVKRMVELAREEAPRSKIVLGGFCATAPDLEAQMDVDHVCVGDGITFMRDLLGLPKDFTFQNPDVFAESREILGVPIHFVKNPHIVVGLGCSYGCDFCCPSHFFGRRHIRFYDNGADLYKEMLRVEKRFGKHKLICFIGDDNFLLDFKRAEELRALAVASGRAFNLMIFGSADLAARFTPRKLAEMGVGVIWIGREGKFGDYQKNQKVDIKALVAEMRSYGIKTILSSILLLEGHTKQNVWEDIDDHIASRPAFSQFAHYSPLPGTPLWDRLKEDGRLLPSMPWEDCHGFKQPCFVHPEFTLVEAEKLQAEAYLKDFHVLGPSLVRYIEADYEGWKNLKDAPEAHLRARAAMLSRHMGKYRVLLAAALRLARDPAMAALIREVREKVESSFGRLGPHEEAAALAICGAGRFREWRTARWGDALQPMTRVFHYNR